MDGVRQEAELSFRLRSLECSQAYERRTSYIMDLDFGCG